VDVNIRVSQRNSLIISMQSVPRSALVSLFGPILAVKRPVKVLQSALVSAGRIRAVTDAKRHHFVPQLLLRRFSAEPGEKNPVLWRVDTHRGTW